MATIQDLLRAKQSKPLQDLLDQYNNGQKFAEGGEVEPSVERPIESDEVLDYLKHAAERSKNVIPEKDVPEGIESGKLKSYVPEDLNNPSSSLEMPMKGVPIGEPYTPLDVKRPWELEELKNQVQTRNAVKANPVAEVMSGTPVGEPYTPADTSLAVRQNTMPAVKPEVVGQGTSNAKFAEAAPQEAQMVSAPMSFQEKLMSGLNAGTLNSMGIGAGYNALSDAKRDPTSVVSKLDSAVDDKISGKNIQDVPEETVEQQLINSLKENPNLLNKKNIQQDSQKDPDPEAVKNFTKATGENDEEEIPEQGKTSPAARQKMLAAVEANRQVGPNWHPPQAIPSEDGKVANAAPEIPKSPIQNILDMYKGLQDTHATDLKDAQEKENKNNLYANLVRGLAQLNSGVTGMAGHGVVGPAKVDNAGIDAIQKNANAPVEQYKQNLENEKNDPNSAYSKGLQAYLAPTFAKLGIQNIGQMSGALSEKVAPWLVKEYDQKLTQERLSQVAQTKAEAASDKRDDKATADQDKNYKHVADKLEETRGGVAKQAETNLLNLANAKSTVGDIDPNKMDSRQVHLYVNEIAKVATGGVPTEAEIKALDQGTATGELAKVWSKMSNKPQPANAGEFIKVYQKYADDLEKNSQHTIADRYNRIINTNKDMLNDKQVKRLQDEYVNRWENEKAARLAEKSQSQGGKSQHKPGDLITLKSQPGKQFRVGADGNSLEQI